MDARMQIEWLIEELIALLDAMDGDENLEPYLAGAAGPGYLNDDCEGDDADLEDGADIEDIAA